MNKPFFDSYGTRISNPHTETPDCQKGCAIHHPSNHHMKDWPLLWRWDRMIFERICPHGIGHPDPDHMRWIKDKYPETYENEGIHGCDGCCRKK